MQIKFLKKVVEYLINKQSVVIIDLLHDKKDVNEFIIAKKLNLTINQTRNILYKMSDFGLVSFTRKKDRKKGWYIYFWTLNVYHSLNLLLEKMNEHLAQLELQKNSRTAKPYYFCNTCSIEVTEDNALLNDFTCTECEQVYTLADQSKNISGLESEILELKKEIELVKTELGFESQKLEKKKERKRKRVETEKKAKRVKDSLDRKKKKASESASKPRKHVKIIKKKPSKNKKK
jgi:transcription factor E